MRQGQQQNRRGRGRNRKGQSPLTRSFESNGPDVKIRGTPAHIAEKYMALARNSMSSGDPVLAENYLQHAEHYNRIIMAFREQQSPNANDVVNGNNRFRSPFRTNMTTMTWATKTAKTIPLRLISRQSSSRMILSRR